jgi:two-component sensor histidine kinase
MTASHILIVDDDAALLHALPEALRLRLENVTVETCDTAAEALTRISATDYDAIISDIKMPGMDGLSLLAEIRARRPDTPTLLITGHGEHDLAVQALRGGAYDFIQKPIDREYFVASLGRAIQVRHLRRRVKELDQLKTQFFANVSHELRTPLTLLLGPTQKLMGDAGLTAEQRGDLEVIERNGRTLLKRVNDLLDIAKLEAGRMSANDTRVDLAQLLHLSAGHFEAFAQERRIAFAVKTPPSVATQADPEKLMRVFLNLLGNAFKFAPDGGRVSAELRVEGQRAVVTVEDNGPGVKPELRQAIFERFHQGGEGGRPRFGGTGLGLAIAQEFVALHGGIITVDDAPGSGALFRVELPLRAPTGAEVPAPPRQVEADRDTAGPMLESLQQTRRARGAATRPEGPEPERPLVLVVEDNPEMNRFIGETLAGRYRVAAAFDGLEGLEKAQALRPDLIISDILMPGLTGDELVRQVRTHSELDLVPILLLTGKVDDDLRVGLLRAGAQDYLTKPFWAEELRARASNLVAIKQVREMLQQELMSRNDDVAGLAREVTARGRQLQVALREKEVLLKELHHRVKNNLQVISSLLSLQSRSITDPSACELFEVSQNRVKSMALIHEQLYQSHDLATIDFAEYVRRLAVNLFRSLAAHPEAISLKLDLEEVSLGIDTALPCGLMLNEIITNALKHAFPPGTSGEIRIGLHAGPGGACELSISDNGIGLPADSASSTDRTSGLQLVSTLAGQLGAAVETQRDGGTQFKIRFPG